MKRIPVDIYADIKTNNISGWRKVFFELYKETRDKLDSQVITFEKKFSWIPFSRYINYLLIYPKVIKQKKRTGAISFFTHQELVYLFSFFSFQKSVVMCYDIIPYLYPGSIINSIFFKFAMSKLKYASKIVVLSEHTKKDIIKYFDCNEKQIIINYPGVNQIFQPRNVSKEEFISRYNIPKGFTYILYVGSEAMHKNITRLLTAYKMLENKNNLHLIKIGKAGNNFARRNTMNTIKALEVKNISIIENVNEEDLAAFYNIANMLVFPSMYEGFGLPPLEAMACGCPVITSNSSSLPEVVGKAAILINPEDTMAIADAMHLVLTDHSVRKKMIHKGLIQARKFQWDQYAKNMMEIFEII